MTDTKIALLIIYNHRYDKNIPRLEALYEGKFTNVFHVIPFYDGKKENVITVYDSSFYFESYIAQAYQKIKKMGFTHFFFVADDMILNPAINEYTLFKFTGISDDCSFIRDLRDYRTHPYHVPLFTQIKHKGIEVDKYLPTREEACKAFEHHGLSYYPGALYAIADFFHRMGGFHLRTAIKSIQYIFCGAKKYSFPGVWAYSDVVLVPVAYMEKFALYCGAFGGLNVFVENAVPLALLLASNKLMLQKDIHLKVIPQLYTLGKEGQKRFEEKYSFSLQKLLTDYPKDWFLCHPIKLSKWK